MSGSTTATSIPWPMRQKKPNSLLAVSICAATWPRHGSPKSKSDRSITGRRGESVLQSISVSLHSVAGASVGHCRCRPLEAYGAGASCVKYRFFMLSAALHDSHASAAESETCGGIFFDESFGLSRRSCCARTARARAPIAQRFVSVSRNSKRQRRGALHQGCAPRHSWASIRVPWRVPAALPSFIEHRPAFVTHQEVVHVIRVLFFLRENPLEHHPCRRVLVAEVAHHVAVGLDGDALGHQILFDHVNQVLTLDEFRCRPGKEALRIEVRLAAELIDPLTKQVQVRLLFFGVLRKLLFDRLTRKPGRGDRVELVAQYAHDFGRHSMVEKRDGIVDLAVIVLRDGAFAQMAARALSNLLDIA